MTKLSYSYTEIYVKMCHVAASMSENCRFLKLLYLSFKAFKSKLVIDTKTTVLSFRLGFSTLATLKVILKLPTPWSPPILIWISFLMNGQLMIILLLKKGKLSNFIHCQCLPEVVIFQSPTLPKTSNCPNLNCRHSTM